MPAVAGIIFIAAFVRSALGFGDAVIAMPLLAMIIGLKTATPLVAFMGPTISIIILARSWRGGDMTSAARLIVASLLGIPLGIYGLARLPEEPLKIALGILILLYGVFGLARPGARIRNEKAWLPWLVGWTAGVLGGAYNTNGPPVVAYGMLRGWPPERFRATLQGYFLPTGLAILAGHGIAGMWTGEVFRFYLYSLPAIVIGVVLGGLVNRKLTHDLFAKLVYGFLAAMGAVLLVRTLL
ncbi:MAG: sulfite exporter TauE/SafE family protein [Acidobacteria bacterium]|nr:sulfite exporter TauE/SafE family protein [Acidobacteriota bacterium]MBE3129692.1 sulfite exporter TauE/SafE family protein [Acidobacteriota bacterium]